MHTHSYSAAYTGAKGCLSYMITDFVRLELLALIPVWYLLGVWLQKQEVYPNAVIFLILCTHSAMVCTLWVFYVLPYWAFTHIGPALAASAIQGFLGVSQ